MTLTDTQIERYSRQIILPEIGGRGQEALLRSRTVLIGVGELAKAVVPYLAGAGIGGIVLRPLAGQDACAAANLAEQATRINPDVQVEVGGRRESGQPEDAPRCELWCETSGRAESVLSVVRAARVAKTPVIAAAVSGSWGWVSGARMHETDLGCIFCGWLDARRGDSGEPSSPLESTVVGAVAALVASSVMDTLLDLDRGRRGRWLRYDAKTLTLGEHTITPREDCPVCGDGAGEKSCHPIPDS